MRRASPEEADEAFALLRRFFAEEGFTTPPEILRERFAVLLADQSGAVFLARREEVAVGVATATTTFGLEFGRSAELEDLYVLPHARDEGAGRALIDAARGWCRGLGRTTLGVVVTPEGQATHDLLGFYGRHRFRGTGRTLLYADLTPLAREAAP